MTGEANGVDHAAPALAAGDVAVRLGGDQARTVLLWPLDGEGRSRCVPLSPAVARVRVGVALGPAASRSVQIGALDSSVDGSVVAWRGGYCEIAASDRRLDVTVDAGNGVAVFIDAEAPALATTQVALLEGGRRPFRLNRRALCEQLLTGAVTGQDTLFEGVERLWGPDARTLGGLTYSFHRGHTRAPAHTAPWRTFSQCVDGQLEVLRTYFRELREQVGEAPVSVGLSGGYDSRLLALLAVEAGLRLRPYTYSSAAHQGEQRCALAVASGLGLGLAPVPVRPLETLDGEALDRNVNDVLVGYDGRTNQTMGTFADVHTARVLRQCRAGAALNLNGLGGELYRNRERLPPYPCRFDQWLWQFVIGPRLAKAFRDPRQRRLFEAQLAERYGALLGQPALRFVDRRWAREWYRNVWLPCFAGVRLSAENRVGPAVMPFADATVSAAALAATPLIGPGGELQSEMMRRLDAAIAALPSTYGPGFARAPLHRRVRDQVLSMVPLGVRLARQRLKGMVRRPAVLSAACLERFRVPLGYLKSLPLPLNLDVLLGDPVARERTLVIAEFLYRQRDRIAEA